MSPNEPAPVPAVGQRISHYTILEEIHRGELQIVYRARDEKLNREVALKVLPPETVRDPERQRRFIAEAKASAALAHPHVGVIHEIDEAGGVVFIAMELLRGPSLAERLAAGALSTEDALDIAIGVAAGLAYAHDRGIIHRDVKPANVVLTDEGHPKIIDFGLAQLLDAQQSPFIGRAGDDDPLLGGTTREGLIAGTVGFMSPEQARGGRVDRRSDIFSFGLLLYTMFTGRPPFEGASRIDVLHAILHEPTPKLGGTAEARTLLEPIVDRCLEKDPDRRYSSMSDVLDQLKRARVDFEAGSRMWSRPWRFAGVAALALIAGALVFVLTREPPPPASETTPSLAVLQFENLSGDPGLDWLRSGLPDMLVTDLSQSPDLEVLGLDRIYPILEEMDRTHAGLLTRDTIEEVARRAGASTVLLGSFARAGNSIRISARLEDPSTGRVLLSEKAEAEGEDSVFRLVDEITARIKVKLEIASPVEELDRDLRDVTTSSLEAYRAYAEGIRLHERFREEEAVPHFQRAIELDPGFAMALAKLGVVMSNLGRHDEADVYAERALENLDRLTARERYYIEGWHYSRSKETLDRAIEAYRKAIELYPDHGSARHNLGLILLGTERYEEAIAQFEELRSRGMSFPATYEHLAMAYKALDELGRARSVLADYSEKHPDDWTTLLSLAQLEIETGNVDRGLDALRRAEALGATVLRTAPLRWEAQILREDWSDAFDTARAMMESAGPVEKFVGGRLLTTTALYRGGLESVLEGIDQFVAAVERNRTYRVQPLLLKARILLEVGEFRKAKETALEVTDSDDPYGAGEASLVIAAIAAQHLGENEEADELASRYRSRIRPALGPAPERLYHFLLGELALERGDFRDAVSQFEEAESMLPPRGSEGVHALIWYSLATAHRLAGDDEAIDWYERILDSTEERLFEPFRYVRSFYFLGELQARDGDDEEARESFERFLAHWGGGEIDRELVAQARARLR